VIYAITPFRDITRLDPYLKDMVLEIVWAGRRYFRNLMLSERQ
jgi:hypothetical protein